MSAFLPVFHNIQQLVQIGYYFKIDGVELTITTARPPLSGNNSQANERGQYGRGRGSSSRGKLTFF